MDGNAVLGGENAFKWSGETFSFFPCAISDNAPQRLWRRFAI